MWVKKPDYLIEGEVYEKGDIPEVLDVDCNYAFGCFSLTLFIEEFENGEYVGIRLSREKTIQLRDEIDRLLKLDDERKKGVMG